MLTVLVNSISVPKDIFAEPLPPPTTSPITNDVSSYLTDPDDITKKPKITVKVDGQIVDQDTTIKDQKEIEMDISFRVPVKNDDDKPEKIVKKGDKAKLLISKQIKIESIGKVDINIPNDESTKPDIKLAQAYFTNENDGVYLNIDFDGDENIFEKYKQVYATVSATFKLKLEAN